jgi:hypothetical protein
MLPGLKEVRGSEPSADLSIDYTYDAVGNILTWRQQADTEAVVWRQKAELYGLGTRVQLLGAAGLSARLS